MKTLALIPLLFLLCAATPAPNLWQQIHESSDVGWLEKVAAMEEDAPALMMRQSAKELRSQAYARLGTIGSRESLDAVDRIEAAAHHWRPNEPRFAEGVLPHPGWHMGNNVVTTNVRATQDGITYAVFIDYLFGDMDLLLISSPHPEDKKGWSRPHLLPLKIYRGIHDMALAPGTRKGTLRLSFTQDAPPGRAVMEGTTNPGETAPKLGMQTLEIDLDRMLRDSDGDGLTDVEEARLGLRPDSADTDGDGLHDGDDSAPDFAMRSGKSSADFLVVLEKAFFATFGISGSRYSLFVDGTKSTMIQPWGYRGQVIYGVHPKTYGAVSAGWKIRQQTDSTATVEVWDGEGPMAAGGVDVRLEKKRGTWYVVAVETTWIS
jgi:hypothetical protein